jgi:hypothetical protein
VGEAIVLNPASRAAQELKQQIEVRVGPKK